MGSSSGTSPGSSLVQNSGSEEDMQQQALVDQRKRKRMISNRESARRSRMRKQKQLDDLKAQVAQLKKDNKNIITSINISTQHYLNFEAENSILRAQFGELGDRLQSLNEIVNAKNNSGNAAFGDSICASEITTVPAADHSFLNPLNSPYLNQPIMASADHMFHEYD